MNEDISAGLIVVLLVILIVGGGTWISASNEAAAFNRFTDGPVATTWDAVWLELRVEACRQ
jgi:hypothetical protein